MNPKCLLVLLLLFPVIAFPQVMQLSFSAINNGTHENLDSIRIKNINQWNDTLLIWPDTTLMLAYVGIDHSMTDTENRFGISLLSTFENDRSYQTLVSLPTAGSLTLIVHDIPGRTLQSKNFELPQGNHLFSIGANKNEIVIVKALFKGQQQSLKMIAVSSSQNSFGISYSGMISQQNNKTKSSLSFSYNFGDYLLLTGWSNGISSSITCQPLSDTLYIFTYGMNYPCPGISSFTYGGQLYHTVQIGDQCWMKENLNIGTMVISTFLNENHYDCFDNGIIEKYCYNNDPAMCDEYGGLYEWDEMMNYTVGSGVQGICPPGWHIPSDMEWCELTYFVDPLLNCNTWLMTGYTAGNILKEPGLIHWNWPESGATNLSGFTGLGAGARHGYGDFFNLKNSGVFWTSSDYTSQLGIDWELLNGNPNISHGYIYKPYGFSIRCVKN